MNDNHLDPNRLQALSRARSFANAARTPYNGRLTLQHIAVGDVVDWSDAGLFLAVTEVTQQGLRAIAVSQSDPRAAVRDIRMLAYALYLRLNNGWLSKVPRPRRL
jgi:hypothetical protein